MTEYFLKKWKSITKRNGAMYNSEFSLSHYGLAGHSNRWSGEGEEGHSFKGSSKGKQSSTRWFKLGMLVIE